MEKYKNFQPTRFDAKGLSGEYHGISEFWVAPCSKHRDSECLDRANFDGLLKALGGESKSVQVHRFNHWANGWFELILISPKATKKVKIAEEIESGLENYPVVDDDLYSQYESEENWEIVKNYRHELAEEIEQVFRITEVELTDNFLDWCLSEGLIICEQSSPYWKNLDLAVERKKLTVETLIEHDVEFQFCCDNFYGDNEDGFNFQSSEYPDLLNASLMRALAQSKRQYTMTDGTEVKIPLWAYENEKQEKMAL